MWGLQNKQDTSHILLEHSSEMFNIINIFIFVNNQMKIDWKNNFSVFDDVLLRCIY